MSFPRPSPRLRALPGRLILGAFLLALAVATASAQGREAAKAALKLSPEEEAWLAAHPVIGVAMDPNFAPFEYRSRSGRFQGLTLDFLERFSTLLGVEFQPSREESWAEATEALEAGRYDMAACIVSTPRRELWLDFTAAYAEKRYLIFGLQDRGYVEDPAELVGSPVGVLASFGIVEFLRRDLPSLELVEFPDAKAALGALARGRIGWFINDLASTGWYAQELSLASVKAAGETSYNLGLCFAARKDRAPLGSILDKALASLSDTELASLRAAWFSTPVENPFDWRGLALVLGLAGLLVLAVLAWNRILALRVRQRTIELGKAVESLRAEVEERRRAEEGLAAAVEERSLLFAELNHRVKNNLQLALSLLRLSSTEADSGGQEAIDGAASRLEAIARVHASLQATPGAAGLEVDLGEYLERFVADERAVASSSEGPRIEAEISRGILVPMKLAVNVGLIVNELFANALKYAFPEGGAGLLSLTARREGEELLLAVADDGIGMDLAAPARPDSLGMGIVRSVVRECHGKLELDSAPGRGTRWSLRLPLPPPS
jgi:two-component sensor histidine kinase/ABC-type amino acid transport substrate-binding protein